MIPIFKPYGAQIEASVLDFDFENRPLSYLGQDWTSAEITAIGWSWVGDDEVQTMMLRPDGRYETPWGDTTARNALSTFAGILQSADIVTGHYIRKHDLPILNSALIELDLPPLRALLVSDTQRDVVRRKDLSISQENLAAMFGMPEAKHHMTQAEWRRANRLTVGGIEAARKRVVDDVIQHKALRAEMIRRKLLRAPRMWFS